MSIFVCKKIILCAKVSVARYL